MNNGASGASNASAACSPLPCGTRRRGGERTAQRRSAVAANNGNDVIGVPKHQINFGAEWDVPGVSGFSVEGR